MLSPVYLINVTDEMGMEEARKYFDGKIIVGKDLLEL